MAKKCRQPYDDEKICAQGELCTGIRSTTNLHPRILWADSACRRKSRAAPAGAQRRRTTALVHSRAMTAPQSVHERERESAGSFCATTEPPTIQVSPQGLIFTLNPLFLSLSPHIPSPSHAAPMLAALSTIDSGRSCLATANGSSPRACVGSLPLTPHSSAPPFLQTKSIA